MRARAGLVVLDRAVDGLLGDGVPRWRVTWGETLPEGGGRPVLVPQARRGEATTSTTDRDAVAERDRIRSELHRAHQRRARRRRLLTRLG